MRGFTLLEIVLAAGLAVIVGTLLIGILVQNNGFFYKQNAVIFEGVGLNDSMQKINNYLRQAVAVESEYVNGSTTYTAGSQTLVLKLSALNGEEVVENIYDFVVVSAEGKILRLKVFPNVQSSRKNENLALTTLLQSYGFKYLDKTGNEVFPASATAVETTLTLLAETGSIASSRTATSVMTLRNSGL